MAQKEIVLQQVRMGKQRDLPDALEKGQISFSTDVARVFIGLPSASEPASLVAGRNWDNAPQSGKENVEILTEFTPYYVINKVIAKPVVYDIKPKSFSTAYFHDTTRAFIEYVAYNESGTILETGNVTMVVKDNKVLIYESNNTIQEEGIFYIEFQDPVYDAATNRTEIIINNSSTEGFRVEFLIRGWTEIG